MNNFVFSNDPLLYSQIVPRTGPAQDPQQVGTDLKVQLDNLTSQYQALQQNMQTPPQPKDILGEIDEKIKDLNQDVLTELSDNQEFTSINNYIQSLIQEEIVKLVKWKINSNQEAILKMNRLKEIISDACKAKDDEDKKNLSELNDYIKNYSDLTFNEYKKLKQNSKQ